MTLTADQKGRLTCRELFPPRTSFAAERDEAGRIILVRLARQESPAKVVRPIPYKGGWLMPGEVDMDKLCEEIQRERQSRDENLLG
jgi:hypothetical protein